MTHDIHEGDAERPDAVLVSDQLQQHLCRGKGPHWQSEGEGVEVGAVRLVVVVAAEYRERTEREQRENRERLQRGCRVVPMTVMSQDPLTMREAS